MSRELPSREEALDILKNSGCSQNVIEHCLAVEELALKIARLTDADLDLVSTAAILHDIGRARTHGIVHAVEGADILREMGIDESIVLIVERHLGAGLSKEEAKKMGLPERDFMPKTIEEKIVAHADNLIEDNRKRPVGDIVSYFRKLGYPEVADKILALHRELSDICKIDLDLI